MPLRRYRVGIDFGTTFSFPAYVNSNSPNSLLQSRVPWGIPSVFYHDKNKGILCGQKAKSFGAMNPSFTVKSVKQKLGTSSFSLDGVRFTPKQIIAHLINHVVDHANQKLETEWPGMVAPIEEIVLAVPVLFGDKERSAIIEAAQMPKSKGGAGVRVLKLIDEPVAAAMDYFGMNSEYDSILVYDLGGGTFDLAYLTSDRNNKKLPYKVIDKDGKLNLGGDNWDDALYAYLIKRFQEEHDIDIASDARARNMLKEEARSAKEELSDEDTVEVEVQVLFQGLYYPVVLTQKEFEAKTKHLLNQSLNIVEKLIKKNSLNKKQNLCIALVGGSSYMPQVRAGLDRVLSQLLMNTNYVIHLHRPEKAIAFGAALYASGVEVDDKATFTYGVSMHHTERDEVVISNHIYMGTELPRTVTKDYRTRYADMTEQSIRVFEHREKKEYTDFSEGKYLMTIKHSFGKAVPKGTRVDVKIELTKSGILEVTALDPSTGKFTSDSISIIR